MNKSIFWLSVYFLFIGSPQVIEAINYYKVGDTLNVWALNGLNLRIADSSTSPIITTMQYAQRIIVLDQKPFMYRPQEPLIIQGRISEKQQTYEEVELKGSWVQVRYKDTVGYVFDAYLSHYPPPRTKESGKRLEQLGAYAEREFGLISSTKEDNIKGNDEWLIRKEYYNKGFTIINWGYKCAETTYIMPNYSIEEILIAISNGLFENEIGTLRVRESTRNLLGEYKSIEMVIGTELPKTVKISIQNDVLIIYTMECC